MGSWGRRWVVGPLVMVLLASSCGMIGDGDELGSNPVPVPAEGLPADHQQLALVADVHGPTSDVSAEIGRLVPFPELPTPLGAHIIELNLLAPRPGEVARVRFGESHTAEGTPAEVVAFYETSLAATDWNLLERRSGETIHGMASTDFAYERPSTGTGSSLWPDELTVTVIDDTDLGRTRIDVAAVIDGFTHDGSDAPVGTAEALQPWFAGWHAAPLPAGGELGSGTSIRTFFGEGRSRIDLSELYAYEDPPFADEVGFQQVVLDEAEAAGLQAGVSRTGIHKGSIEVDHPDFDPLYIELDDRFTNGIRVLGQARFATPPFDAPSSESAQQGTDPLPAAASISEIEAVVNDIHGPSLDVSAQMQRLGPFPDLRTPNGATILRIEAGVQPANEIRFDRTPRIVDPEGRAAALASVRLVANGTLDEVEAFYLTDIEGRDWEPVRQENQAEESGSARRRFEYDIADIGNGNQAQFAVEIDDDVDAARVTVSLDYVEFVPTDRSGIERFSSWVGSAPFPDGGRLDSATIRTEEILDTTLLHVAHAFDDRSNDELLAVLGEAIAASDYAIDPDRTITSSSYPLTRPDVVRATVGLDSTTYVGELADQVSPEVKERKAVGLTATLDLRPGEVAAPRPADDAAPGQGERTTADVTDPLSANAPLDELMATLADVHGPTDDVSGQMLRLGRFPDLPTPIDTSIVGVAVSISTLGGGDTTVHYTTVAVDVAGPGVDVEQVTTYYRTQIKSRAWELTAEESVNVDDGTRTTFEFERVGAERVSSEPALTVTVSDDAEALINHFGGLGEVQQGVLVVIRSREAVPTDRASLDRLLGWSGDAPIPDGTVTGASIQTTQRGGLQGGFHVHLDYELPAGAIRAAARAAAERGDYRLAAEQGDERSVRLTHPSLSEASFTVLDVGPDRASATFDAFTPIG